MAYNPNRPPSGPHRSTPLIQRPRSNPHQFQGPPRPSPVGMPSNYLGNMLGGALAGMGYPAPYAYPPHPSSYSNPPPPPFAPSPSPYPYSYSSLPARPSHSALSPAPAPSPAPRTASSQLAAPPTRRAPVASNSSQRPTEYACQLDSCSFVSRNRRTTREHEEDRHLLFEPGREPKPWSGSLKPLEGAVIEGTGISLDTPEAVAKWIADRKKRWPSKKVVEDKEKARDARVKAGLEDAPRERGAARGRGRGTGRGDSSARGRGRGGGGSYGGPRHAGERRDPVGEEPVRKKRKTGEGSGASSSSSSSSSSSDSEGEEDSDDEVSKEALKALLGKEADEEGDDNEEGSDDDLGPVEEASSKPPPTSTADDSAPNPTLTAPTKQYQVVCRHWRKGNCALGDASCPYLHIIPADQPLPPPPRRTRPHPRPAPPNPFARPFRDAFELLEDTEVKHVVSDVLQVVDFLRANDWLRGVELSVGQLDDESGIEVLAPPTPPSAATAAGGSDVVGEGVLPPELELEREPEHDPPVEPDAIVMVERLGDDDDDESTVAVVKAEQTDEGPTRVVGQKTTTTASSSSSGGGLFGRGGGGLVADYSSSDDDEEGEEQVKKALLSSCSK